TRTKLGAKLLEKGKKVHLTSSAGTDLLFDIEGRNAIAQYGASDVPGRWDHWPAGITGVAPIEDKTKGVLVLNTGDIILKLYRYILEPVKFYFENGKIVEIEGSSLDAILIREWFASWNDDKAYIPSHIGWGTEHRAVWSTLSNPGPGGIMDAESFYGGILFGIGANFFQGLGGKNVTAAHIDLCMRSCNFYVDDKLVVENNKIVINELK
ncbi:unnamed protein product, partial [marine sediment metagenome]